MACKLIFLRLQCKKKSRQLITPPLPASRHLNQYGVFFCSSCFLGFDLALLGSFQSLLLLSYSINSSPKHILTGYKRSDTVVDSITKQNCHGNYWLLNVPAPQAELIGELNQVLLEMEESFTPCHTMLLDLAVRPSTH